MHRNMHQMKHAHVYACIFLGGYSQIGNATVHDDDDVSFYNSTASTWTLATPRTTWESYLHTYIYSTYLLVMVCLGIDVPMVDCFDRFLCQT